MRKSISSFISILFTLCVALSSCTFDGARTNLGISLYVPKYLARTSQIGAKIISPATASIYATIRYEDGTEGVPVNQAVVPGERNTIRLQVRLDVAGTIRIESRDSGGIRLTSGDIRFDKGAMGEFSAALKPDTGAILEGGLIGPQYGFFARKAGGTEFFAFTPDTSGYFLASRNDYGPCWIGAYDAATGSPLPGPASDQSDGWTVFRVEARVPILLAVAMIPDEGLDTYQFGFKHVKFISDQADAQTEDGTMEHPYDSFNDFNLGGQGAEPDVVYLLSGSFPIGSARLVESSGGVIGGYSPDFLERGARTEIYASTAVFDLTGVSIGTFLCEDVSLSCDQNAYLMPTCIDINTPYATIVLRDCHLRIPDCTSSRGNSPATCSAVAIGKNSTQSTILVMRNCSIAPADIAAGQSGATLAGVLAECGSIDIERCDIRAAAIVSSDQAQNTAAAILVRMGRERPFEGGVRLVGNRLDGGNAGTFADRAGRMALGGIIFSGNVTPNPLVIARNYIYAGNYALSSEAYEAWTFGIALGYLSEQEDPIAIRITNNIVSGGRIDCENAPPQSDFSTFGIYSRFNGTADAPCYIAGNTIESGAVVCGQAQKNSRQQSIAIGMEVGVCPPCMGNTIIVRDNGQGVASGLWALSQDAFVASSCVRNAFLTRGRPVAYIGNVWNPESSISLGTAQEVNDYSAGEQSVPEGNFDILSEEWLVGHPAAGGSAMLLVSAWEPAPAHASAFAEGAHAGDILDEDYFDIEGKKRPASGYWTVGAYQL